jgi:UrcA family protein
MSKSAFASLAILAFGAVAGQAFAEDAPTAVVKISNVNFSDTAAVDRFYVQLKRTAEQVCDSNSANPRIAQLDQLCVRRALSNAVRTVDRPTLTARYQATQGAPSAFAEQGF